MPPIVAKLTQVSQKKNRGHHEISGVTLLVFPASKSRLSYKICHVCGAALCKYWPHSWIVYIFSTYNRCWTSWYIQQHDHNKLIVSWPLPHIIHKLGMFASLGLLCMVWVIVMQAPSWNAWQGHSPNLRGAWTSLDGVLKVVTSAGEPSLETALASLSDASCSSSCPSWFFSRAPLSGRNLRLSVPISFWMQTHQLLERISKTIHHVKQTWREAPAII